MKKISYILLSIIMTACCLFCISDTALADDTWVWPVPSIGIGQNISTHYGQITTFDPNGHEGIDIYGALDTPIVASKSGTVCRVVHGNIPKVYLDAGNAVVIDHGNGVYSHYAHLNSTAVSEGQYVQAGETIGYMGDTGVATGVHLHFAIAHNSTGKGDRIDNEPGSITYVNSSYNEEVRNVSVSADHVVIKKGTRVNFTINSNVVQGQNDYYFDMYAWKKADYESGETTYVNGGNSMWFGVTGTSASYTFAASDTYYVRCRVHNNNKEMYSAPIKIIVLNSDVIAPSEVKISADMTSVGVGATVTFSYTVNQPYESCDFNVEYEDNGIVDKKILPSGTSGGTVTYTFNNTGRYGIWLAARNSAGSQVSTCLIINVYKYPGKPTVTYSSWSDGSEQDEFIFSWDETTDTDWYDIRFYDSAGNRIKLIKDFNKVRWFRAYFPEGSYSMDVAAVSANGTYTFSSRISFNVKSAITPTAGTKVDSCEAEHRLYEIYDKKCSWLQAEAIARENGNGTLAAISSETIQNVVGAAVAAYGHPVWIGGEAFRNETWTWVNGDPFTYTNWVKGEPSGGIGVENCIQMGTSGLWNDIHEYGTTTETWTNVKGYVVEYEPVSVNIIFKDKIFHAGYILTKDDVNVSVTFTNGITIETTDYELLQSGVEAGNQSITVEYGGVSATEPVILQETPEFDFILPADLIEIEDEAFENVKMTSVFCSDRLAKIGAFAFYNCTDMRHIYIPESVVSIDETAFSGCDDFMIWGVSGSVAEQFANSNGITFVEYDW